MNNHPQQTMDSEQFVKRLGDLGIMIDIGKLQRWSNQKLIPDYKTHYQPRRKKRGRPSDTVKAGKEGGILEKSRLGRVSDWPEEALEEAAAVWAVRNSKSIVKNKKIRISKKMIDVIKRVSPMSDHPPQFRFGEYIIRPKLGPPLLLERKQHVSHEDIELRLVKKTYGGLSDFPGKDDAERADLLDSLTKTWTAAICKVRQYEAQMERPRRVIHGSSQKSQIWPIIFPLVWPITKPASVRFSWWYRPGESFPDDPEKKEPTTRRRYTYSGFKLGESDQDQDDIALEINGVDTRKLFIVDVDDSIPHLDQLREEWLRDYFENEVTSPFLWQQHDYWGDE
jgi:hypothetical protein